MLGMLQAFVVVHCSINSNTLDHAKYTCRVSMYSHLFCSQIVTLVMLAVPDTASGLAVHEHRRGSSRTLHQSHFNKLCMLQNSMLVLDMVN